MTKQEVVSRQGLGDKRLASGHSAVANILAVLPTIVGGVEVGRFAINEILVEMHFELLSEQGAGIGDERRCDSTQPESAGSGTAAARVVRILRYTIRSSLCVFLCINLAAAQGLALILGQPQRLVEAFICRAMNRSETEFRRLAVGATFAAWRLRRQFLRVYEQLAVHQRLAGVVIGACQRLNREHVIVPGFVPVLAVAVLGGAITQGFVGDAAYHAIGPRIVDHDKRDADLVFGVTKIRFMSKRHVFSKIRCRCSWWRNRGPP